MDSTYIFMSLLRGGPFDIQGEGGGGGLSKPDFVLVGYQSQLNTT